MWMFDEPGKASNLFFFLAAVALLIPAIREVSDKRYRDQIANIERRLKAEGKSTARLRAIKEQFDNERFGGYAEHKLTIAGAVVLTALGGLFLAIDFM